MFSGTDRPPPLPYDYPPSQHRARSRSRSRDYRDRQLGPRDPYPPPRYSYPPSPVMAAALPPPSQAPIHIYDLAKREGWDRGIVPVPDLSARPRSPDRDLRRRGSKSRSRSRSWPRNGKRAVGRRSRSREHRARSRSPRSPIPPARLSRAAFSPPPFEAPASLRAPPSLAYPPAPPPAASVAVPTVAGAEGLVVSRDHRVIERYVPSYSKMHENDRDRPRRLEELYAREREREREKRGGDRPRRMKDSYRRSRSRSRSGSRTAKTASRNAIRSTASAPLLDPAEVEARRKENERLRDERERKRREQSERATAEPVSVPEGGFEPQLEREITLLNGSGGIHADLGGLAVDATGLIGDGDEFGGVNWELDADA
ncbi:hypothetical protein HDU93_003778 [Gonapodya sp. JEL0774]|nr:hypothetical protein HDU93_003778 [Gonapodya sp. JEL0774]